MIKVLYLNSHTQLSMVEDSGIASSMKVVMDKGSAPVIVPMWARNEQDKLILCLPPKVCEALINEEKEKYEDSAAS